MIVEMIMKDLISESSSEMEGEVVEWDTGYQRKGTQFVPCNTCCNRRYSFDDFADESQMYHAWFAVMLPKGPGVEKEVMRRSNYERGFKQLDTFEDMGSSFFQTPVIARMHSVSPYSALMRRNTIAETHILDSLQS
jgi:hypothetical protein